MDNLLRKMIDPYVKTLRTVERGKDDSNLTEVEIMEFSNMGIIFLF